MLEISDKLIVALDVDTIEEAKRFVSVLYPTVRMFKIGSQLFTAYGPEAVKAVGGKGAKVFLDLKFHDIPKTVYSAVASGTASTIAIHPISTGSNEAKMEARARGSVRLPVFMMTLHTLGGAEMLKAAVKGATNKAAELKIKRPYLVGVTVLTSEASGKDTPRIVLERASLARGAGLDGVVCSVSEAPVIRKEFGSDFIIVTPGIRSASEPKDDQKRTATAKEAVEAGANFIVVGRPILKAKDPLTTVNELFG
jgi:orotidine-5'-phosphate decarboxylase